MTCAEDEHRARDEDDAGERYDSRGGIHQAPGLAQENASQDALPNDGKLGQWPGQTARNIGIAGVEHTDRQTVQIGALNMSTVASAKGIFVMAK